jgi:hypothetical protein
VGDIFLASLYLHKAAHDFLLEARKLFPQMPFHNNGIYGAQKAFAHGMAEVLDIAFFDGAVGLLRALFPDLVQFVPKGGQRVPNIKRGAHFTSFAIVFIAMLI